MKSEIESLKRTATRLWSEGQLSGEQGQKYLTRKASLMGLDDRAQAEVATYVEHLNEALDLLRTLSSSSEVSDFATQELEEFCSLTSLNDAKQEILSKFQRESIDTLTQKTIESVPRQAEEIIPRLKNEGGAKDHTTADNDDLGQAHSDQSPQSEIHGQGIWVDFIRTATTSIRDLQEKITNLDNAEELLRFNLENSIGNRLKNFESLISAELVRRGHLKNEAAYFNESSSFLLEKCHILNEAAQIIISKKHDVLSEIAIAQRENTRYVGSGSYGMIATAGVLNAVGGIFSGVGNWRRTQRLAKDLNQQALDTLQPHLEQVVEDYADTLSKFYDALSILGLERSSEMLRRMQDAHYVIDRVAHISDHGDRLKALGEVQQNYPFVDVDWLEAVCELVPFIPNETRKILDAAAPNYVGPSADIDLAHILIDSRLGLTPQPINISRVVRSECITLRVPNGPWPLPVGTIDRTTRTRIAVALLDEKINAELPPSDSEKTKILDIFKASDDRQTNIANHFISLLKNLSSGHWAEASVCIGVIRKDTNSGEGVDVLEDLFLSRALGGAPGTLAPYATTCAALGLEPKRIRRANGSDLLHVAMWRQIDLGSISEAKHLASLIPEGDIDIDSPPRARWLGSREVGNLPGPKSLNYLAHQLLAQDLPLQGAISNETLWAIFACSHLKPFNDYRLWSKLAIELFKAEGELNSSLASEIWLGIANKSDGLLRARALCRHIVVCGYHQNTHEKLIDQIIETGCKSEEISRWSDDSQLLIDFSSRRSDLLEEATNWVSRKLQNINAAAIELVNVVDPNEHRWNDAQREMICGLITTEQNEVRDFINGNQLLACWLDAKSYVLLFTTGVAYKILGSGEFGHLFIDEIDNTSPSGWINDYLKIQGESSEIEIPVEINGKAQRETFDHFSKYIMGIARVAQESFENDFDERWNVFQSSDWANLYAKSQKRSRYVIRFNISNQSILKDLDSLSSVQDTRIENQDPEEVKADARDKINGAWLELARANTAALDLGRTTTLYKREHFDERKIKEFLERARKRINDLPSLTQDAILVYYDETLTGIGDRGIAVCTFGIVWTVDGEGFCTWQELEDISISGLISKKISIKQSKGRQISMVTTQGNREAGLLVSFIKDIKEKHNDVASKINGQ